MHERCETPCDMHLLWHWEDEIAPVPSVWKPDQTWGPNLPRKAVPRGRTGIRLSECCMPISSLYYYISDRPDIESIVENYRCVSELFEDVPAVYSGRKGVCDLQQVCFCLRIRRPLDNLCAWQNVVEDKNMLKGQVKGLLASLGLADMNLRQLLTQGVNLGVPLFRSCLHRVSRNPTQIDVHAYMLSWQRPLFFWAGLRDWQSSNMSG